LHTETGTLEAREPFEFSRSLAFARGFGSMGGQQEVDVDSITKAVTLDGRVVAFTVKEGKGAKLEYGLFSSEPISDKAAKEIGGRIAFFLSLDDDVGQFYSMAKEKDPKFYPLVESAWGLHHVKFLTFLEVACWALINQRIQRPIALRIKRSLTERFGGSLEVDGKAYWAFPDGTRLKAATPAQLMEVTKNQRITRRLLSLASSLDELDEVLPQDGPLREGEGEARERARHRRVVVPVHIVQGPREDGEAPADKRQAAGRDHRGGLRFGQAPQGSQRHIRKLGGLLAALSLGLHDGRLQDTLSSSSISVTIAAGDPSLRAISCLPGGLSL
jgi:DNA-3-methyladenine glycosylase II